MITQSNKAESIVDVFDYVVVGAGPSAIGIIRGLLETVSRNNNFPSFSIAIVERGYGPPHDTATYSPRLWYEAANPSSNSTKSVKLHPSKITGRAIDVPVGQGLGGTSNINACLCIPPLQQDLRTWPDPFRSKLISNAKYLKRVMENNKAIQYTSMENTHNPFSLRNSILKFRNTVPTTTARDVRTNGLVRRNYYSALLEPLFEDHPHLEKYLHWFRGHEAQRLLLNDDNTRVIGIECIPTGRNQISTYREILAKKRIILCAGAIETPALMLVSKVGDKEPLMGVGQHLRDQALLARVFFKRPSFGNLGNKSNTNSPSGIVAIGHLQIKSDDFERSHKIFQVAITDSTVDVSIIPSVVAMALRWKCQMKIFEGIVETAFRFTRIIIHLALVYTPIGFILQYLTTTTMIFIMHPRSRGSVIISPNKNQKRKNGEPERRRHITIDVDPNYLDDPRDIKDLKSAWDASEEISSSTEIFPNLIFSVFKLFRSKTLWFESYCRYFLLPYYHYCGTCAMIQRTDYKDNQDWVVNSSLKVRGLDGLYICDASVFPSMISNPPALTCAALGYQFASLILAEDHNKLDSFETKQISTSLQ